MINANELRIGNIFKCYGITIIVDSINSTHVSFSKEGQFLIADLEPIPLIPNILEKCGADKRIYGKHKQNPYLPEIIRNTEYYDYKLGVLIIDFNNDNVRIFIEDTGDNYEIKNEKLSLHQLQNLYFALTQTELEIKF